MAIYTVYTPPMGSKGNRTENIRFIEDGKSVLALVFAPFWLAWHRLWVPLLLYTAFQMSVSLLVKDATSLPLAMLTVLPSLYLLLEGSQLLRNALERKGWHYSGVVDAQTKEEAELRFFARVQTVTKIEKNRPAGNARSAPHLAGTGLFPE